MNSQQKRRSIQGQERIRERRQQHVRVRLIRKNVARALQAGRVEDGEMKRTFNMGIGMVLVVSKEAAERVVKEEGEMVYLIGEV
ncbi:unnamed protein product [Lactuca virosa]|uniref:phosphoribosylformylglycinamidine cyclo-ligase n=1 Tax=Lactuca virosa TaxID=75947 RepID=A0AAU9M3K6_9ASTR|nr:unnamed protein product [Lactuca virosa]